MKQSNNGFSLVEVLVFLTIISLVFIVGATVATVSIKNSISAENKILATRYAEELKEWLKGQKEADWQTFTAKDTSANGSGTKYCFTNEPVSAWPAAVACQQTDVVTGTIFQRQATLTFDNIRNQVDAAITVSWNEAGNSFSVPINTIFAPFE